MTPPLRRNGYPTIIAIGHNFGCAEYPTWLFGWCGKPGEGIPYCIPAMHPDHMTAFFDATPGSWSTRGDDALDRKSARMQRDYEIASKMTAALRSTLAHMWLRRPISDGCSPYRIPLVNISFIA